MMTVEMKPLPNDLIDALLADYKKPEDLIGGVDKITKKTKITPKKESNHVFSLRDGLPSTTFEPTGLVDLSSKTERERLSGSALKGFFNLVSKWNIKDEDARELLGGISNSAFYEWKKNPHRLLDVDRITRISFLIGIYKALHLIYGDKLADEWVSLPNKNAIFAGRTPLQYMLSGGLIGMQTVRKLLDARRGGV
jgi:hypothetical protein